MNHVFRLNWRSENTMGSNKVKHLKNTTCRVIKIDKEALFEFIYEMVIDNLEEFFDIIDGTVVTSHHKFDSECGEYICLIKDDRYKLPDIFDIEKLISNIPQTTDSFYSPNRYKEMTFEEIKNILANNSNNSTEYSRIVMQRNTPTPTII